MASVCVNVEWIYTSMPYMYDLLVLQFITSFGYGFVYTRQSGSVYTVKLIFYTGIDYFQAKELNLTTKVCSYFVPEPSILVAEWIANSI